jgi:DNA replication licensing factor MCM6
VDFHHVLQADAELAEALQTEYVRFEPYCQRAVRFFVEQLHPEVAAEEDNSHAPPTLYSLAWWHVPASCRLRNLRMDRVGQLVTIAGCTVTRTSEVRPELLVGSFRCQSCGLVAAGIAQNYQYTRPTLCRNPRCGNASPLQFWLETSASQFGDWQKLRVQEASDEIPPGGMPRSLTVLCRNEMVERTKAGDVCTLTGYLVVLPDGSALARAGEVPHSVPRRSQGPPQGSGGVRGLAALGVRELSYRTALVATTVWPSTGPRALTMAAWLRPQTSMVADASPEQVVYDWTRQERQEIRDMKASPNIYEQMVDSLCPTVFGHREIRKGLLLLLLGGVHKTTADGTNLRGDLNVCIVGDPSTAKSQFLKYIHSFCAPRAVYTSGKASSAAGLTAAVQKDPETGEFGIEAGALMLADNGICCIDEL